MATPRARNLRPAGVARALLRLLVLIVLGFGVGLVFGVVTEEPELLAGHLRGDGESVALDAESPATGESEGDEAAGAGDSEAISVATEAPDSAVYASAAAAVDPLRERARPLPAPREQAIEPARPPVAAARPTPRAEALRPTPAPRAVSVARRVMPPSSATGAAGDPAWAIQVGAFSEQGTAERVAGGLRDRYPVAVLPANTEGGRWRVRVQPIAGEDRAREIASQLKQNEQLPTWVTPMEGRSAP